MTQIPSLRISGLSRTIINSPPPAVYVEWLKFYTLLGVAYKQKDNFIFTSVLY
jgi:hypothetical protein